MRSSDPQSPERHCTVVGGAGFLGRYVCEGLARDGYTVSVVGRATEPEASLGVAFVRASVGEVAKYRELLKRSKVVVALASSGLPATAGEDIAGEIHDNVEATVALAEACARSGVETFVFSSSGGTVYGPQNVSPIPETAPCAPINAYGASKLAVEYYLSVISRRYDMRCLSLRVANPYGPGQSAKRGQGFIAAVQDAVDSQRQLSIWGDGSAVRDFVWAPDVGDAFVKAARYSGPSAVINIGTGVGTSLRGVIALVHEVTGHRVDVVYSPARGVDVPSNVLDPTRAEADLGWRSSCGLRRGIELLFGQG